MLKYEIIYRYIISPLLMLALCISMTHKTNNYYILILLYAMAISIYTYTCGMLLGRKGLLIGGLTGSVISYFKLTYRN